MSNTSDLQKCPKCGLVIPVEAPQGLCPKCLLARASLPTEAASSNAQKPAPPSIAEVAAAFPQLEILELIGQGGMGFVFKARQSKLERLVALKILPPALAADPAFAERFTREGRALARLNHPNIVTIHDFGQAGGFFYLLMEFVDGVNLREAMRAGRFTPAQALAIVPKICEALQYAHDEGVLHRDIKPGNILIDTKGRIKIADFGVAKLMGDPRPDAQLTGSGGSLGTAHYMAPEQVEKPNTVDHRADIYSLGVVFYEMLTGELPLGKFLPPSRKVEVDVRLDEIVLRALEKEPERRYQEASQVKTAVETIATSSARASTEKTIPDYFWRWFAVGVAVATFVVVMLIAPSYRFSTPANKVPTDSAALVLEQRPGGGPTISHGFGWHFKCLIPANHIARMALVFWTNGTPRISLGAYVKVGNKSTVFDHMDVTCGPVNVVPGGSDVVQWEFYPGFSANQTFGGFVPNFASQSGWVSNQPPYQGLDVAQWQLFVRPGHQLIIPLVQETGTDGIPASGFSGVELRVALETLNGPLMQTLPDEFDRSNYIAGYGFAETTEETLRLFKTLSEDRAETTPLPFDRGISLDPSDLREAKAKLAELRVTWGDHSTVIQSQRAVVKELERLSEEEPGIPADLRAAEVKLAELRVNYGDHSAEIQAAMARVKELKRLSQNHP